METVDAVVDVVIVGAGAAGLSLARRLAAVTGPDGRAPSIALVEPPDGPPRSPRRTWCYWEQRDGAYDTAVAACWDRLRVTGPDGRAVDAGIAPLRYKMLRSTAFEALTGTELARHPHVHRITGVVTAVHDGAEHARVDADTPTGPLRLCARWVYDSRPAAPARPGRTRLLQHFRGWFVRTEHPAFDPATAHLMDFRTPQPTRGLSFAYVLPTGPCEALVEYTEFSPAVLDDAGYDRALRHYARGPLGLTGLTVVESEQGVIPMTDAGFARRLGARVFRIGTAGGATRPSTGYTFSAVQRQARGIAAAYAAGRVPVPPPPHRRRHLAMDAVLLRALDRGRLDGAAFFTGLFRRNPAPRLLRFLDGTSTLREEIAVGLHTPVLPMSLTAAELTLLHRHGGARRG